MGSGEAKELMCMTRGHELRGELLEERGYRVEGGKEEKTGTTVIT